MEIMTDIVDHQVKDHSHAFDRIFAFIYSTPGLNNWQNRQVECWL